MIICPHCSSGNVEKRGAGSKTNPLRQKCRCNNCSKWFRTDLELPVLDTYKRSDVELSKMLKAKRFIITSAQNNIPVDKKFWKAINLWAEYYKAQIMVIPITYILPTNGKEVWWAPEVIPYLIQNEIKLAKGIRVFGDLKIAATTVNPISGLESLSQGDSAIMGHAQIQMKTIATPQHKLPKILQTTGTCTEKHYSDTKAGKKGSFHHSLGAVIVESDGDVFHLRSVTGDERREFYDLDLHCTPNGVKKTEIDAIVLGDEHALFNDPNVRAATFDNKNSIVNTLKPKLIVRHDVIDSYSISHHHKNSPSTKFKKRLSNTDDLRTELEFTARFVEQTTPKWATSVIVPSNHHNHISRWLEEVDWRTEPWNAVVYHELWSAWLKAIESGEPFHPFVHWMKLNCKAKVQYLKVDEPFTVHDIYIAYHGDRGPNGVKGTITNMSRIGAKTIIGHTHSPGIDKGCFQVGTSSLLSLDYTSGPSSWLHTHCLIHKNGKRQLINIINGKWRAA